MSHPPNPTDECWLDLQMYPHLREMIVAHLDRTSLREFRFVSHGWKTAVDRRSLGHSVITTTNPLCIITESEVIVSANSLPHDWKKCIKILNLTGLLFLERSGDFVLPTSRDNLSTTLPNLWAVEISQCSPTIPAPLAVQVSVLQPRRPSETRRVMHARLNPKIESDHVLWVLTGTPEEIPNATVATSLRFPEVKRVTIIFVDAKQLVPIPDGFWCACTGGQMRSSCLLSDVWCPDGIAPLPPGERVTGFRRYNPFHFHWRQDVIRKKNPGGFFSCLAQLMVRHSNVEWHFVGAQHWSDSWLGIATPNGFEHDFRVIVAKAASGSSGLLPGHPNSTINLVAGGGAAMPELTFVDRDEVLEELARNAKLYDTDEIFDKVDLFQEFSDSEGSERSEG
ncbi:hypothetical protein CspHIS471_0310970 [Cutaneotrichosporon sp. HIS471]|nr:hypothetical protein CspHIS471_0310970 [Cutaneotrichosporon sp. HIS471]